MQRLARFCKTSAAVSARFEEVFPNELTKC